MLKGIFIIIVTLSVLIGTTFMLNFIAEKFPNSFLGKLFSDGDES